MDQCDMKFWPDAVFCLWPSRLMCSASTCEIMVGKDASLHVEQSFRLFMSLESSLWWCLYAPLVCFLRLSQRSSQTWWLKATEIYSLTVLELRSLNLTVYLTSQALVPSPTSCSERTRENSFSLTFSGIAFKSLLLRDYFLLSQDPTPKSIIAFKVVPQAKSGHLKMSPVVVDASDSNQTMSALLGQILSETKRLLSLCDYSSF